ncbi:hypothetical protein GCM10027449_21840 [Sinomonas notoginsengisoli]|uniref:FtsB family cell division protein n=1 Tax=Sinomonas notoginsengisoli TaxID=1457311 RepID=UPI001F3B9221|nr:septum formation initiator family protein [Sinomonas notoginsengisoli]
MATRRPAVPRTPAPKRPSRSAPAAEAPIRDAAASQGSGAKLAAAKASAPEPTPARGKSEKPQKPGKASKGRTKARPKTPLRTPVPTDEGPVPARAFSGRIIALAVVLVAITIMLAPTVRVFLGQRAEISSLQADIAAKRAEQDSLRQSIGRWEDQNYVKQQARDRINMVMPGETAYWVFGDAGAQAGRGGGGADPAAGEKPWAQGFWDSLVRAATD